MTYPISELRFIDDSQKEQTRTRKIFDDLKIKANSGAKLTEHEKNFFCQGVVMSRYNEGSLESYTCCDNYKFNFLYLVYFRDISGGSSYEKINNSGKRYNVSPSESQIDLDYLIEKAEEMDLIIKNNYSDLLLNQVIIEARKDLKILDNLPEVIADPYAKGKFNYRYKRWAILLRFKWIYGIGLEYFESTEPEDLLLKINNEVIEFNEFSLIHILNRHYSKITKNYQSDKSFHIDDFEPRRLSPQLKSILKEIDDTQLLSGKAIKKIAFKFNTINYLLWCENRMKAIKQKGNVNYKRVESFYPVTDSVEISKLNSNYSLHKVNDRLELYVEK